MGTQRPVQVIADGIVGRHDELSALRTWLDLARQGAGRLVLCSGEPGIGKTRLAQELAGAALAAGTTVAWGRCAEGEGAPAFWPWRQVLRSLVADPDSILGGDVESPEDRFRGFDRLADAIAGAADKGALVVILDDVHSADEPSLLVLRHVASRIASSRLLVFVTFRHIAPSSAAARIIPDLLRSPGLERIDLSGFSLEEVREQLSHLDAGEPGTDAQAVLDLTAGNPLFVREVIRSITDGTWRPDRPPRSVLDVVSARLDKVSAACRRLMQAAAVVGRDFSIGLVAAALDETVASCLPLMDEAAAHGLVDRIGAGDYRFVHALTRDAVEASLTTAHRIDLHRTVARSMETQLAGNISEHLSDIARRWGEIAPYGEAATARIWAIRAAEEAVRRLAYEEGVRLYRAALSVDASKMSDVERCNVLVALGRAAYFAGDLQGCSEAALAAVDRARAAGSPELMGDAALVLEATPDAGINTIAKELCEEALAALPEKGHEALRARLLAQRSHLAFYDGQQDRVEALSTLALDLARSSGDDRALLEALHARKEACPGPSGGRERSMLATEMLALGQRTNRARSVMWGQLWRIDSLVESGRLAAAAEEIPKLQVATGRVGGPVSAWHLDRVTAHVAQAQGRYAEAATAGRRAHERMSAVEPRPALGAWFSLQCALSAHTGVTEEARELAQRPFDPLPRFVTIGPLTRSFLLLNAGLPDEAAASYQQAGPVASWSLPAFFILPGYVYGILAAAGLGQQDDLDVLLERLRPFRGEHVSGEGVIYLGPVDLALGRGAAALGSFDVAIPDLEAAVHRAAAAGAAGFLAEAHYHLARALVARNGRGDRQRARSAAQDADRLARALGMTAYVERTGILLAQLVDRRPGGLSRREIEVAKLVADGLTNRQIAGRLFVSERTAENHVQHVLTKLGFTTRSQIAAWSVRADNE